MAEEIRYCVGMDLGQVADYTTRCVIEQRTVGPDDSGLVVVSGATGTQTEVTPGALLRQEAGGAPTHHRRRDYTVRNLHRYDLGTRYPDIVEGEVAFFERNRPLHGSPLVVDYTGPGRPVVDDFVNAAGLGLPPSEEYLLAAIRAAAAEGRELDVGDLRKTRRKLRASVRPVTLTAGASVSPDGAGFRVAKKVLVASLLMVFQSRRLVIPKEIAQGGVNLSAVLVQELLNFRHKITQHGNDTYEAHRDGQHDDLVLAVALPIWYMEQQHRQFWMR